MKYLSESKKGFSLVEIMITLMVVGALSGLAAVYFVNLEGKTRAVGAEQILNSVLQSQRIFLQENGGDTYANSLSMLDIEVTPPKDFGAISINPDTCNISMKYSPDGTAAYTLNISASGEIFCNSDNDDVNPCPNIGYSSVTNETAMGFSPCIPPPPPDDGGGDDGGGDDGSTGGGSTGGNTCFLAGTSIAMADGSTKPIEEIHAGDIVVSFNEKTKQLETDKVNAFMEFQRKEYYIINDVIKASAEHPFYVEGKWVETKDLEIGNLLLSKDMAKIPITSIEKKKELVQIYNIEVDRNHTFVAAGIIVHNKETGGGELPPPEELFF